MNLQEEVAEVIDHQVVQEGACGALMVVLHREDPDEDHPFQVHALVEAGPYLEEVLLFVKLNEI